MPNNDRYTVVFDVFQPHELFSKQTQDTQNNSQPILRDHYINTLISKEQVINTIDPSVQDPWATRVFTHQDIFEPVERGPGQQDNDNNNSPRGKEFLSSLQKVTHLKDTKALIDHRFTKVEVTPIDMLRISSNLTTKSGINVGGNEVFNEPIKARVLGYGVIRLFNEWEKDLKGSHSNLNKDVENNDQDLEEVKGDKTMVAIIAIPSYFTATDLLGFVGEDARNDVSHFRLIRSQQPNRFIALMKFRTEEKAIKFQKQFNGKYFNSMEPETCHIVFIEKILFRKTSYNVDSNSDSSVNTNVSGKKNDTSDSTNSTNTFNNADDKNGVLSRIPYLLGDPFTTTGEEANRLRKKSSTIKKDTLVELPTCPVCLERMDCSITGLLTIQCQHTFHCQCLSKWDDDSCPVCRYTSNFDLRIKSRIASEANSDGEEDIYDMTTGTSGRIDSITDAMRKKFGHVSTKSIDEMSQDYNTKKKEAETKATEDEDDEEDLYADFPDVPAEEEEEEDAEDEQKCSVCKSTKNLWICLICGNIGCGRYDNQHAMEHFNLTMHCFAMDCNSSRVWDYIGDNYVHRLIQNEADGKLVELPEEKKGTYYARRESSSGDGQSQSQLQAQGQGQGFYYDAKIDKIGFEYSKMLISQLESQREYYEYKFNEMRELKELSEKKYKKYELLEKEKEDERAKEREREKEKDKELEKEINRDRENNRKFEVLKASFKECSKQLKEERTINEGLSAKIDYLTQENKELKLQVEDMKAQVEDVMFYLTSQEKFKDASEEVREGQIVMKPKPKSRNKKK